MSADLITAARSYARPHLVGAERGDPRLTGNGRAATIGAER